MTSSMGLRIAMIRRQRLITQVALAEEVGTTRAVISYLERGKAHRISADVLMRIARALHCSVAELHLPPDAPVPRLRSRPCATTWRTPVIAEPK
jgi:transcriptional regulator with XRE-family HTH domain